MKSIRNFFQTFGKLPRALRGKNAVQTLVSVICLLIFIVMPIFIFWPVLNGKGEVNLWVPDDLHDWLDLFLPEWRDNWLKIHQQANGNMYVVESYVTTSLFIFVLIPFSLITSVILIVMILRSILSVVFKFLKLGMAWARQLFLQGPGAWWMGVVVRNAAFGGRCKQVLRPHELPEKERACREAISEELNQKMSHLSRKTAAQAGEALYSALAEGDASQIKDHVRARLTDSKLAHCQYYCEDEIINRIAELIAAPPSSLTSGFDSSKRSGLLPAP